MTKKRSSTQRPPLSSPSPSPTRTPSTHSRASLGPSRNRSTERWRSPSGEGHVDLVPGPAVDETVARPGHPSVAVTGDPSARRHDGIQTAGLGEATGPLDIPVAAEPHRRDVARRRLRQQLGQPFHVPALSDQSGQIGFVEPPVQQVDPCGGTGQPLLPLGPAAAPPFGHPLARCPPGGSGCLSGRVHRRRRARRRVEGPTLRRPRLGLGSGIRPHCRFPWPLHGSPPRCTRPAGGRS